MRAHTRTITFLHLTSIEATSVSCGNVYEWTYVPWFWAQGLPSEQPQHCLRYFLQWSWSLSWWQATQQYQGSPASPVACPELFKVLLIIEREREGEREICECYPSIGQSNGHDSSRLHDPWKGIPHKAQELEEFTLLFLLKLVRAKDL